MYATLKRRGPLAAVLSFIVLFCAFIGYSAEESIVVFLATLFLASFILAISFEGLYDGRTYKEIAAVNAIAWCLFSVVWIGYLARHGTLPVT